MVSCNAGWFGGVLGRQCDCVYPVGAALIDLDMLVLIGYVNVSDVAAPGAAAAGMRVDADSVNLFNAGAI
jgi:hypothetical protein